MEQGHRLYAHARSIRHEVTSKVTQRAALEKLSIVLKAAGSSLEDIVKVNIYLKDMPRDFGPMNEVYAEVSSMTFFAIIF